MNDNFIHKLSLAVAKEESQQKGNGSDYVIGIRIKGTVFHFYSIEISEAVCDALRTLKPTAKQTPIMEIGKTQGYDFWNQQDRDEIVFLLDYLRVIIPKQGSRNIRHASFA